MPKYLSPEWFDEMRALAQDQPERPGASATMQFVVTGAPDGDVKYYWVINDGRLAEASLGEVPDPEVTMTTSYADAVAGQKGELDPNAAVMQGKTKVTGNMGKLMQLMPITMSPEYRAVQDKVRAITEF